LLSQKFYKIGISSQIFILIKYLYKMKKEFDGPSFINPSHTSYSLNNGKSYQKPEVTFSKQTNKQPDDSNTADRKKGVPRGGNIYI
jgi:hypothetical protein